MNSFSPLVDDVEKDFKEYMDSVEQVFDSWLGKQSHLFDELLYMHKTYYFFLNYLGDKHILSGLHQGSLIIASKTSSDLWAIYNCLKSGCIYQASSILRSLFETLVTTDFIFQDYNSRIELYYNHKFIEQFHKLHLIEEYRHQEIKEKYYKYRNNYTERKSWYFKLVDELIKQNKKMQGKKPNFRTLCHIVNRDDDYERVYSSLSLPIHGSTVLDHMFIVNGSFNSGPKFNSDMIGSTIGLTINFSHEVVKHLLLQCNHTDSEKLTAYSLWLSFATSKLVKPD